MNFILFLGQTPVGIYIFLLIISWGKFVFLNFANHPPPPPIIVSNDPSPRASEITRNAIISINPEKIWSNICHHNVGLRSKHNSNMI